MIIDFLNQQFEKQNMKEINEDVKSFLQAFQTLHKLSNGFYINADKMDRYYRLFEFSVWDSLFVRSPESFLIQVLNISQYLTLKHKKEGERMETQSLLPIWLFIVLPMLNELVAYNDSIPTEVIEQRVQLFNLLNSVPNMNMRFEPKDGFENLPKKLLMSNIFDNLYTKLEHHLTKDYPINLRINKYLFPLAMAISVKCKERIVEILSNILRCNSELLEGMIAIIDKDISQINSIKYFASKFSLHQNLVANLMKLVSNDTKEGEIYGAWFELCKDYCNNPELVSSIVALLNKDLSGIYNIPK
jgi:hypothetical protein